MLKIEHAFEIKAEITLKENDIVILNKIPFSKDFLQQLSFIFEALALSDTRENLIAGLAGHMWLLTRLEEEAPFKDHQEQFFTTVSTLFDAMKQYQKIVQFEKI